VVIQYHQSKSQHSHQTVAEKCENQCQLKVSTVFNIQNHTAQGLLSASSLQLKYGFPMFGQRALACPMLTFLIDCLNWDILALVFSCILSSKPSLVCEQAGLVHRHNLMMTESVESVELTSHGFDWHQAWRWLKLSQSVRHGAFCTSRHVMVK